MGTVAADKFFNKVDPDVAGSIAKQVGTLHCRVTGPKRDTQILAKVAVARLAALASKATKTFTKEGRLEDRVGRKQWAAGIVEEVGAPGAHKVTNAPNSKNESKESAVYKDPQSEANKAAREWEDKWGTNDREQVLAALKATGELRTFALQKRAEAAPKENSCDLESALKLCNAEKLFKPKTA